MSQPLVRAPLPPPLPVPNAETAKVRAAFDAWLRADGYAVLTANKSAVALHTLVELALAGQPLPERYRPHGMRALRWLRSLRGLGNARLLAHTPPCNRLWAYLEQVFEGQPIVEDGPNRRAPTKVDKLSPAQWKRLVAFANENASETPEALVLLVCIHSPLRIGKILDMPLKGLRDSVRNEHLQARLGALQKTHKNLAETVSEGSRGAAYQRMKRYLYEISTPLGFDFDFNALARTRLDHPKDA
jgi:hypothetical protein